MPNLMHDDPEVARIIRDEESRVENTLDLIAAENHAPRSIFEAQGSIFSTKAAEGYPGSRFHAGCGFADELESLAIARAKRLFGAEHANLQPHSGVAANLAVYFSVLEVGDRILTMKLSQGGHLSHGDPSSITSKCFNFQHYGLNPENERIDYKEVKNLADSFRPHMMVAGASSYSRLIDYEKLAEIARGVSAYLLVDMAHIAGLVAAEVIPSPVPHSDFVTFTGYKTMMVGRGGVILAQAENAGTMPPIDTQHGAVIGGGIHQDDRHLLIEQMPDQTGREQASRRRLAANDAGEIASAGLPVADPGETRRRHADIDANAGNHMAGTCRRALDLDQNAAKLAAIGDQIVWPFQSDVDAGRLPKRPPRRRADREAERRQRCRRQPEAPGKGQCETGTRRHRPAPAAASATCGLVLGRRDLRDTVARRIAGQQMPVRRFGFEQAFDAVEPGRDGWRDRCANGVGIDPVDRTRKTDPVRIRR